MISDDTKRDLGLRALLRRVYAGFCEASLGDAYFCINASEWMAAQMITEQPKECDDHGNRTTSS
jgi:hypothetical protein